MLPLTKTNIPLIIGLAAILGIAGIFAFAPIHDASTVHTTTPLGSANILTLTKVIPTGGADVTWTFTAPTDAMIHEIYLDNSGTIEDCTQVRLGDAPTIRCKDSGFSLNEFTNGGSKIFRGTQHGDVCVVARNNVLEDHIVLDEAFGSDCPGSSQDEPLLVPAGDSVVMIFDSSAQNYDAGNPVTVKVTIAFVGGSGAELI